MFKRLLLLLLVLGALAVPARAQEPSNPYIYYYSDALHAFIVERADGTDTRVLGASVMTLDDGAQDIHVKGPGWSPSGEWFAWTAAQISNWGYGWSGYRPYVIRADGTQRLTLLDHLPAVQLAWAADEDVLFVASRQSELLNPDDPDDHHSVISTYLAVIDVPSGTVIAAYEDQIFSDYYLYQARVRPTLIRMDDSAHVIASYVDYAGGDSYYGTQLAVMLSADGTITETRLEAYGPISMDGNNSAFPSISPAGWVAYPTADSFHAQHLLSGKQHTLPPLNTPETYRVHWDASGQYALINDGNLRLLDCATGTLTPIRYAWKFHQDYTFGSYKNWPVRSPDSRYALLLGADSVLYALDRTTGVMTALEITIQEIVPDVGWYWLDAEHPVIYNEDGSGVFVYDLITLAVQRIGEVSLFNTQPRLNPGGDILAFVREGAVIYTRDTGHELEVRPSYRSYGTFDGGEVLWHDSGDWLLISEESLVAGGAYIRNLGIVRADGALRRDLSFRWWPNTITVNWLPPQVDLADLPPSVETPLFLQPAQTLHRTQWSYVVDWSPDGRWLATGSERGNSGSLTLWDMNTGDVAQTITEIDAHEQVFWPSNDGSATEIIIPDRITNWTQELILAHSPDGRQIVLNRELLTYVVDAETGKTLTHLHSGWPEYFWSASYSPNGRLLAAVNPYMPVRIWNTTTWELIAETPNPGQAVAFSPDGTQLAVTASWDVQIWDVGELLEFGIQ